MRRLGVRWRTVTAIAGALALLAAGGALALAVSAGAAPLGSLDDTTAPVTTEPAPDPAPTPKPKPAPKPTSSTPKRTYSAPTRTYSAPTYTPPRSAPTPTKRHVVRKPKRQHKKAKPAVTTTVPTETTPLPSVLVPVPLGARRAPQADSEGMVTSVLFVAGVSFAALLFMLAAMVPGTAVRFTPVGRVVIDHQQDFVLVGLAAFLITVFVYVLTGHGL